jgi:putative transposase
MIKKNEPLSVVRQCRLLEVSRSSVYYKPAAPCEEEPEIKRLMDIIHTKRPFKGSRRITDALQGVNYRINRKRVQRLMKEMNIQAIYPKPNTSRRNAKHKVYPYLLRNLTIDKPNQAWATDVTYIPMPKGFVYLTVIMDWYSRKVLSWRLSNSMDVSFCVDALEEALYYYGKPDIFNSDQGSQYTSKEFTQVLKDADIRISMDGKGAWRDNVFVERLWRSVKYEEIYLNAYESMKEAKDGIGEWIEFYNRERKHQTLGMTPDKMYGVSNDLKLAA